MKARQRKAEENMKKLVLLCLFLFGLGFALLNSKELLPMLEFEAIAPYRGNVLNAQLLATVDVITLNILAGFWLILLFLSWTVFAWGIGSLGESNFFKGDAQQYSWKFVLTSCLGVLPITFIHHQTGKALENIELNPDMALFVVVPVLAAITAGYLLGNRKEN